MYRCVYVYVYNNHGMGNTSHIQLALTGFSKAVSFSPFSRGLPVLILETKTLHIIEGQVPGEVVNGLRVSINGGTQTAGWFISWKIPSRTG